MGMCLPTLKRRVNLRFNFLTHFYLNHLAAPSFAKNPMKISDLKKVWDACSKQFFFEKKSYLQGL